jgi:hypothetical protein
MSSIVSSITGTNSSVTETKTRANLNGEPIPTFKFKTEEVTPRVQSTIIESTNIGGATLIWGNSDYGIWGVGKWGNSANQTFVLGLATLGSTALGSRLSEPVVILVKLEGNYVEDFGTLTFCDTSNTTADWGVLN